MLQAIARLGLKTWFGYGHVGGVKREAGGKQAKTHDGNFKDRLKDKGTYTLAPIIVITLCEGLQLQHPVFLATGLQTYGHCLYHLQYSSNWLAG